MVAENNQKVFEKQLLTNEINTYGTKCSRMDQVKLMEDSL